MMVVYASKTGNVERFMSKLPVRKMKITNELFMHEPFVLVTYTTGFGQVPTEVQSFLERNDRYLRGVAASGNQNWGTSYGKAGDTIAAQYQVPIVHKFELSGTKQDAEKFLLGVEQIEQSCFQMDRAQ
ncbi:class Ib ribonucleoside-diphosphate reductase assembly flavoprotein NrdI [Longirhabdus pacifica]|uniref:class Ib ribonucleoside-diphosphate reductase assembly flavoprotein NrdI n=1 Tax=Longirhabdus pacifica TaxID=2305227 RepID=UPI00100889F2|nr:class Ib ribonucleoside-diphosphate reductase assembly flavoprotein NrdI [Longirhabdus pacifica]